MHANGKVLLPVLVIVAPLSAYLRSSVFATLWGWFVVPLGVPPITLVSAFGLSVLFSLTGLSYFRLDIEEFKKKSTEEVIGYLVGFLLVSPLFSLFMGWLAHFWI